jgi:hypothetical protein
LGFHAKKVLKNNLPNSLKLCHVILQKEELPIRLTLILHAKFTFKSTEYEFFKKRSGLNDSMLIIFSTKLGGKTFGAHEKARIFAAHLKTTATLIKPNVFAENRRSKNTK